MKKIGILTFHFANNYGAVLQCCALRRVINTLPGCSAEVINYIPSDVTYGKCWNTQRERTLFQQKRDLFKLFLQKHCNVEGKTLSFLNGNEYDYFCVGSDQVWNTGYLWTKIYFLPFESDTAKKISYAASVGVKGDSEFLDKRILKEYLPDFCNISVREQEHIALIEAVTGNQCECVLDPTLLLDSNDYEELICNESLREKEFIFFFWINHDDNVMRGIEFVNTLSGKYKLSIVHSIIGAEDYLFNRNYGCMMFEGVENFLWYVKNARFVVTNSYHATLFSIQFKKIFWSFIVTSMRSRFDSLVEKLGIEDRIIESYLPFQDIEETIEYSEIFRKLNLEREKSMKYLCNALDIN